MLTDIDQKLLYISIHALHEESDVAHYALREIGSISIHALHEESDGIHCVRYAQYRISIHALHEESDAVSTRSKTLTIHFNPRSP